jgi:two-component system response regulator NreC
MNGNKIRVLICDDHSVFRHGVKSILSGEPDMEVIGEAGDGAQAVHLAKELQPDVVLMDIAMPVLRGFDAARRILRDNQKMRVLMLTVYDDEELVARCLTEGAAGYVLKDSPAEQLVYAVRSAARGEQYVSPKALKGIVGHYVKGVDRVATRYDLLSDREREILVMLAEGSALKDVASKLKLSVKTVDAHRYNIMTKLGLHDRTELIRFAIRNKLIES